MARPADTVARLRDTFDAGGTRPLAWRLRQLDGLERLLVERRDELAAAIDADLGRGAFEGAMFDVAPTLAEVRHARRHLRRWARPQRVPTPVLATPGRAWVRREPLGVALVVSPWNYPVHLALAPIVGALAAGNCVVLKPSELTPTVSAELARLLPEFLDPRAVAVVEGGPDETMALLEAGPDHVLFTGSTRVGRIVARAAAERLIPATLELGGKSPAIVTAAADLRVAARRVVFGKVTNSGQTCIAPDYVLVERGVRDRFLAELATAAAEQTGGRALPLLNAGAGERLTALVDGSGGEVRLGGAADGARMPLTVVADPDPASALLAEEIFGPVLPVVAVDGLAGAVATVRSGERPLAAYLFSDDPAEQRAFEADVVAGGMTINHTILHLQVPGLPFGGVGASGTGSYHGRWGFETFSHAKAVLRQGTRVDLPLVYPPYRGLTRWLMRRLLGR